MAYYETTSGALLSDTQTVTTTADSTNVYDVTGAGAGNAPAMIGAGGLSTAMAQDLGAGEGAAIPQLLLTFEETTTVSGTLTVEIKAAPDDGAYSAGTYYTLYRSEALTGASKLFVGKQMSVPLPPVPPNEAMPRFYKVTYTVTGSIDVDVTAVLLFNAPTVYDAKKWGENFSVYSG